MNLSQVDAFRQSNTELKTPPAEPAYNITCIIVNNIDVTHFRDHGHWGYRGESSRVCVSRRDVFVGLLVFYHHMTQGYYSCDKKLFSKLKFTMTRLIKITVARLTVRHNNYNKVVSTIKWANQFRKKKSPL